MTLLRNVRVFGRTDESLSVLIRDGVIAWVGTEEAAKALEIGDPETIDGDGSWLAPGFVDNHVHLSATGMAKRCQPIFFCTNALELERYVSQQSSSNDSIYIGHGWDDSSWADQPSILDVPFAAYVSRIDVHSAIISQALIDRIPEITNMSGFSSDGSVTGAAHSYVRSFIQRYADEDVVRSDISAALTDAAAHGIVAVHEMSGPSISGVHDAELVLETASLRTPRVFLWWGELMGHTTAETLGAYGCGGDLFVDGSFGSRTALLRHDYVDGGKGIEYLSTDAIAEHLAESLIHDLPVGFHAIGDGAIQNIVDALLSLSTSKTELRQLDIRIEHAEYALPEHLQVLHDYAVCLSVQPQFDATWGHANEMYEQRLGERHRSLNPLSSYAKAGIPTLYGSDSPVTPMRPWQAIRAAIAMSNPEHSLSLRAAFRAHTTDAWRQIGDGRNHAIEIGQPADVALWRVDDLERSTVHDVIGRWSTDPRSGVPELPSLTSEDPECLMTFRNGEIIYASDGIA